MRFLLWGEQLFKTWAASGSSDYPCVRVDNWDAVEKARDWDGLIVDENSFGSIRQKALALAKPVAVLVAKAEQSPWKSAITFEAGFWEQSSQGVLTSFAKFTEVFQYSQKLDQSLASVGASQSELADSTAALIHKLEQHIQIAAEIQKSLLPSKLPKIPGVALTARFFPSHGVGGDYYDIFEFGDKKRFGFLLADSQTHGMAAALLSALLKLRIEQIREDYNTSADFLTQLGQHIQSEVPVKTADLHLFYGILDRSSLSFRYSSAGSLRPVLWRGGKLTALPHRAVTPVKDTALNDIPENVWALEPGDYIVLATKGLDQLVSPKSIENWIEERIRRHENWPDLLDVQNELAAIAHDTSSLTDDVTLLQFSVDPRALYLKTKS